ncbi:MAG: DUF177 domain-containing protein [Candidatus Omnitrophota bacterium]
MKIKIDDIPKEGLELEGEVEPNNISIELDDQGVVFNDRIKVLLRATKLQEDILLDIKLEAPCELTCARCLARIQNIFKKEFSISHEVASGDILDIDEDVRQELVLDYPVKTLCKNDCKGLCPNCGQNLNVGECSCS